MRKKIFVSYLKILVMVSVIIFFILSLFKFIFNANYFNIEYIITPDKDMNLGYLKGKNIFKLNLESIFNKIKNEFSHYRILRISIQLPNRLIVKADPRKACAYLRLYRDFAIDFDGIVFEAQQFNPELPIIFGLERKIGYVKPGQKLEIKGLKLALKLIKEFNKAEQLKKYKIRRINIDTGFGLAFFMDNIEVKIDERIDENLKLLIMLISQLEHDLNRISYIDLRFKDPVIKYER
ncbi:MAG: cell division protein FtsQ [Candidatus Omnitrophica bacterium]|nr:cell division protein FtsQ [Candidatus Omnitrophota bacterium]